MARFQAGDDPNKTSDINVLYKILDEEKDSIFLPHYYREVRRRVEEIQESNRLVRERTKKAEDKHRLRSGSRHVIPHNQPGDLDYRNYQYAGKRSLKTVWKKVSPSVVGAWAAYKGLESEGFLPPIKSVMWEVCIVGGLVVGIGCVCLFVAIVDEKSGEFRRK